MIPASETANLIGVPTYLEEIEPGAEVAIPGLDYLVTVRDTDTAARRDDNGKIHHVVVLTYERHDGALATYEHGGLTQIRRYVPLDDAKMRASYGELTKDETSELVPALIDEVGSLRARLDEARRARATAEQLLGVGGGR